MKITVMIPVYRHPKRVADIAERLLADRWEDKEILVAVDGDTNAEIEAALDPLKGRIVLRYNDCQLGKAATMDRIALSHQTDVFLMLDNDIQLPDDPEFLAKLASCMENCDFAEIPKEAIRGSLISRMMSFEFLTYAMLSHTLATRAGRSPSMNGAAFAVRARLFRELGGFGFVVNEDMDFAARAFEKHARFGYPESIKVGNETPQTVREWFVQRKRWALNNILWLKDHGKLLVSRLPRTPALFLASFLLLLPLLMNVVAFIAAKHSDFSLFMPILFHAGQHLRMLSGVLVNHADLARLSIDGLIASSVGMLFAAVIFFVYARILKFRFNVIDFLLFYLIYSPIWMISNIVMLFAVLVGADVRVDWKVAAKS
jgi:cellulose synthase/poly-beta-1,6-N-acetylglucosamine synthase-like glycosyltransferase